mgnify:CR=1 FL=1
MTDIAANLTDADGFYEQLLNAHLGLDEQASALLNAKLILVMANHIGDLDVLKEAIQMARDHLDE